MELPSLDYINSMAKGDAFFVKEILSVIQEELPIEYQQYCKHLDQEEWMDAAGLVHKIKHKFTIFGLEQGVAVANNHEAKLRNSNPEDNEQFIDVVNVVRDYVQEQNTL